MSHAFVVAVIGLGYLASLSLALLVIGRTVAYFRRAAAQPDRQAVDGSDVDSRRRRSGRWWIYNWLAAVVLVVAAVMVGVWLLHGGLGWTVIALIGVALLGPCALTAYVLVMGVKGLPGALPRK